MQHEESGVTLLPKPVTLRDPARIRRVQGMHCWVCWAPPPNEAHHIRLGLSGGTGMKPSDELTIPLCHTHHSELHTFGEDSFLRDVLNSNRRARIEVLHGWARSL